MAILLLAIAGFFIGGTYSFWRQGKRGLAVVLGLFALLSLAAAGVWARA